MTASGRLLVVLSFVAHLVIATVAQAQPASGRPAQFFDAVGFAQVAKVASANARGVKSQAVPVRLNARALFELDYLDEVRLTLPSGATHTVVFELAQDHGGGVASWVGHLKEHGNASRVILTRGPGGAFGLIETPEGTFRIVPGGEHDWLVDMTQEQLHLPLPRLGNDMFVPPSAGKARAVDLAKATAAVAVPGRNSVTLGKATPAPQAIVDLMFVVTQGLANNLGNNLATRLNFLVTRANTAYADSEVAITLRLVHTTTVNYTDANADGQALDAITPGQPGFDAAVFGGIEALRNSVGADLVALMRNGDDFGGSGVAWLGSSTPDAGYMYSVTTGCLASCESVFIHELGHNMGNAHDRKTVAWQSGGTANYSDGAYPYSYGYVFCKSGALSCNPELPPTGGGCPADTGPECSTDDESNFRDIMAYFGGTARDTYRFSNPGVTCTASGGDGVPRPCGVSESLPASANTALSMNNNRMALSALKAAPGAGSRLVNIATRGPVFTGDSVMIGGFIIQGTAPKKVVVTARGPSMAAQGVSGTLSDPFLTLYSGATPIATNDDFSSAANAGEIPESMKPGNAKESAILTTLSPGAYTAIVTGVGGTTGIAIVEAFEVDKPESPLVNIATRAPVLTGDNVMIGGFIISGDSPRTVLVTARGPSLSAQGVPGTLANPMLTLYSGQTVIAANDDWGSAPNATAIQATGVGPTDPLESAILTTLNPGAYTAIVTGAGGATGIGIVEVFAR